MMFFSFDGVDGAGKTTQMRLFCEALRAHGFDVVECRDPGSTELGERVRELLLSNDSDLQIGRRSEMLLYMAARAQLVEEVIRPAIEANRSVVSDRFLLANLVYQGHAGGLDIEAIREIGRAATAGIMPDCIFVLDIAPEAAGRRLNRPLDRMESQGIEYLQRVRNGFLAEASRSASKVHVVNANRPIEAVRQEIWSIALDVLAAKLTDERL
jgi:dTMP kinase